jgi:hypothetical protein
MTSQTSSVTVAQLMKTLTDQKELSKPDFALICNLLSSSKITSMIFMNQLGLTTPTDLQLDLSYSLLTLVHVSRNVESGLMKRVQSNSIVVEVSR